MMVQEARRRRRAALTLATAVVGIPAALGLAVVAEGRLWNGQKTELVAAAASGEDPTDFKNCPTLSQAERDGQSLPSGVVAIRLCSGVTGGDIDFLAPSDLLTTDVDRLREMINSAPSGADPGCSDEIGLAYRMAMSYPDGSIRVIEGRSLGCNELRVGETTKPISGEIWEEFLALLAEQRGHATPPSEPPAAPECPDLTDPGVATSPLGRFDQAVVATLCAATREGDDHRVEETFTAAMTEGELRTIQRGIENARDTTSDPNEIARDCPTPELTFVIVGRTQWRDTQVLPSDFCFIPVGGGYWLPDGPTKAVLDRLIAKTGVLDAFPNTE